MTEESNAEFDRLGPYLPLIALLTLLIGSAFTAIRFGVPAVVLWLAFAALTGAVLLFWEAIRSAVDPAAPGDESHEEHLERVRSDLEAKKKAALRAIKDIDFERSIGRLSDDDHAELRERYRAEARAAMEAYDQSLGTFLDRAERLAKEQEEKAEQTEGETAETPAERSVETPSQDTATPPAQEKTKVQCKACETSNDTDATFCKRCGERLESSNA